MEPMCLIVVDVQKGFSSLCPKELPVPGALEIVPNVNKLLDLPFVRIDATQDWHPPDHCSFESTYPPHCVAGTPGAEFLPNLNTDKFSVIWRKGYQKNRETYSVVAQHHSFPLALNGAKKVFVCGIATNICVKDTAVDLTRFGYNVFIVEDASAGIDVGPFEQKKDKADAQSKGIHFITTDWVVKLCKG